MTGLAYHPTAADVLYARTDVGGAYRWDETTSRWIALNDSIASADAQLHGVLGVAVDRQDSQRVYLAAGQYTPSWARNAAVLRSSDRGATWTQTELPFKLGGNEAGRSTGERLQVDPNLGSVLMLGSTANGLWRSTDRAATWTQLATFAPTSVTFVLFDPRSGTTGAASSTIYAGVNTTTAASIYRSTDSGASWSEVPGQPVGNIPHRADIDANGVVYITYSNALGPNGVTNGAVWKLDTATQTWTSISPAVPLAAGSWDRFGYAGLALDPQRPGTLVVSTLNRYNAGDNLYRSTDGGQTWRALRANAAVSATNAPWVYFHQPSISLNHWMGAMAIDPRNPDRIWFGSGVGVFRSNDLTRADTNLSTTWTFASDGIEETVISDLVSPPSGAPLLSAMWDIGGFRHDNFTASPAAGMYSLPGGHNRSIDFAEANPNLVVRTSTAEATRGFRSTDGGTTWAAFGSAATGAVANGTGKIAISAGGTSIVWMPEKSTASFSTDNGLTWTASAGSPGNANQNLVPVADRVDDRVFSIYDRAGGRVHVSTDGGASFTAAATVPAYGGTMRAVPGLGGHLWLPTPSGIRRSTDRGASFTALAGVQEAYSLGFGRAAPGQSHPAVFVWGRVAGVEGLYRSDDIGATWTRINDDAHRYGYTPVVIGDPRVYGRVYVGTGGRGIVIGERNP